jgi:pimeloyl-ACP methyl ester carboxylesterase
VIKPPSLVITGSDDAVAPEAIIKAGAQYYHDVTFVTIQGGHNFFLERVDEFNAELLKYLKERDLMPSSAGI